MTESIEERRAALDADLAALNGLLDEMPDEAPTDMRELFSVTSRYIWLDLFFRNKMRERADFKDLFFDLDAAWTKDFHDRLVQFNDRNSWPLAVAIELMRKGVETLGDDYQAWYDGIREKGFTADSLKKGQTNGNSE